MYQRIRSLLLITLVFFIVVSIGPGKAMMNTLPEKSSRKTQLRQMTNGSPKITGLSESRARIEGGAQITIQGENFEPESQVFVGDGPAGEVEVVSATEIRFRVPRQILPGQRTLSVQTRGGIAQTRFTIVPRPVSELNPGEFTYVLGGAPYNGDGLTATDEGVDLFVVDKPVMDKLGNIYVVDVGRIRRIDAQTGMITSVAGTGIIGNTGDGGPALAAQINPTKLVMDSQGNLVFFQVDTKERSTGYRYALRKIDGLTGEITTVYQMNSTVDGDLLAYSGKEVAIDGTDNLYFLSGSLPDARIVKFDLRTQQLTTIVEVGRFAEVSGGAFSSGIEFTRSEAGKLYVKESAGGRIHRIDPGSGVVTVVAGTGKTGFSGDGGPAVAAQISAASLYVDGEETLYFSEFGSRRVRRVDGKTGIITMVAGNGSEESSGDGGPATKAGMSPGQLVGDGNGNLLIGDGPGKLRRVDARSGIITTIAGTRQFYHPPDMEGRRASETNIGYIRTYAIDAQNNLYFAKEGQIYRVDGQTGLISRYAGTDEPGMSGDGGQATGSKLLTFPSSFRFDQSGSLLFTDLGYNSDPGPRIRRIDARTGVLTTIAGNGVRNPNEDDAPPLTGDGGPAVAASIGGGPFAVDRSDNLVIAETFSLRFVNRQTGIINRLAGRGKVPQAGELLGDGGPARDANLTGGPVAIDQAGNIFFVDTYHCRIRRIDARTGIITTVAGNGKFEYEEGGDQTAVGDGKPATEVAIGYAHSPVLDGKGNLFFKSQVGFIRRVDAQTGSISTIEVRGNEAGIFQSPEFQRGATNFDRSGNLYVSDNYLVVVFKGVGEAGAPGIGPGGTTNPGDQMVLSRVDVAGKILTVTGTGLGAPMLTVFINDVNVTSLMKTQSATQLTLKGNQKKLRLKPGTNTIKAQLGDQASNVLSFTIE